MMRATNVIVQDDHDSGLGQGLDNLIEDLERRQPDQVRVFWKPSLGHHLEWNYNELAEAAAIGTGCRALGAFLLQNRLVCFDVIVNFKL